MRMQPGGTILLAVALVAAWPRGATALSPAADASDRPACEWLMALAPGDQAQAFARMKQDLAVLAATASEFDAAMGAVSPRGLAPGQVDLLQRLWQSQVEQLQAVLPDVPGADSPRARLTGWISLLGTGVGPSLPVAPVRRGQGLKLAVLDAMLKAEETGSAQVGQYLRRLRNIGDFLAEASATRSRAATRALATASFDLAGHFGEVERRFSIVLADPGRDWSVQCPMQPVPAPGRESGE